MRRVRLRRGFTMTETLVALGVMAFSLVGISGLQVAADRNLAAALANAQASRLAAASVDEATSRGYGALLAAAQTSAGPVELTSALPQGGVLVPGVLYNQVKTSSGRLFERSLTVQNTSGAPEGANGTSPDGGIAVNLGRNSVLLRSVISYTVPAGSGGERRVAGRVVHEAYVFETAQ